MSGYYEGWVYFLCCDCNYSRIEKIQNLDLENLVEAIKMYADEILIFRKMVKTNEEFWTFLSWSIYDFELASKELLKRVRGVVVKQ
jgi:hypothetical protein